jgi:hypothetical protein
MKKMFFVSACMIALSTGGAFAQNQPAPGASSRARRLQRRQCRTRCRRQLTSVRHPTEEGSDNWYGQDGEGTIDHGEPIQRGQRWTGNEQQFRQAARRPLGSDSRRPAGSPAGLNDPSPSSTSRPCRRHRRSLRRALVREGGIRQVESIAAYREAIMAFATSVR